MNQALPRPSRIVLAGMMGAGKTEAGRILAKRLRWRFFDSDALLEEKMNSSIAAIFARHGERVFRARERETVMNLLTEERAVLSLGGGALMDDQTRRAVKKRAFSLWLVAAPEILAARLGSAGGAEAKARPLIAETRDLPERLARILRQREASYASCDEALNTEGLTAEETAAEAETRWKKRGGQGRGQK